FVPLYELGTRNFREDAADFATVRGWALPARHVVKFLMPDAFGNPADHSYIDVFEWERVPLDWVNGDDPRHDRVTSTDFGIKNYVEGGAYMGILVMALAGIGLLAPRKGGPHPLPPSPVRAGEGEAAPPYRAILAVLGGVSLTFAFGLPTYALLYYLFPNINQLHTPFRWVWPLTFTVAALAGFGADALARARTDPRVGRLAGIVGAALL